MNNLPGCFGMAVTFSSQSESCGKCVHATQCAETCRKTLLDIHTKTDVSDFLEDLKRTGLEVIYSDSPDLVERHNKARKKIPKRKVSAVKLSALTHLPRGSFELARKMLSLESNLIEAVANSRNPFCGLKPAHLEPSFELVLKGMFKAGDLKETLQKNFPHWTEDTVRSYYHSTIKAFEALNLIVKKGGVYVARGQHGTN
ncbi:hypothetical protein VCR15J2_390095 [Vibrio coralliirubri]|uniref:hypothetical protein n=1 Tax=Vibrio coralliirubri TaxID=1516159 RepID=UPI000634E812|nr:hypothetical protein [Vibrio coralliirubri]CDT53721.1 hypothetical protein VCR15J2_390095 [Vibrio coralliirubri]